MSSEQQMFDALTKCIQMTQSGNPEQIKKGEQHLEAQHLNARFGPMLLKLLTQSNLDCNVKLGASIYFKNYVKKYWGRDEDIISVDDQALIKRTIVRVMLEADKNTQRLVSEAISIIAGHDFYAKWDSLLPELIEKLKGEKDFFKICGVLRIIESITARYPDTAKSAEMVAEIKYILELFQDLWLSLLTAWCRPIVTHFGADSNVKGKGPPQALVAQGPHGLDQMRQQIASVEQLVLIFLDLASVDLIAFFENNMSCWAKCYEALLATSDGHNVFRTGGDIPGPVDSLRTAIVRALKLFNSKYEEEYSQFVPSMVAKVCGLLTTVTDDERYDRLAAESIGYLSSVASQQWNAHLFAQQSVLNDVVQRILIRNIRLRDSDLAMYDMNGEDWVLRDMEGSDLYTRRRGAVDLVRGLMAHFEAEISAIIVSQIGQLMVRYAANPKEHFVDKDTAIALVLAVSIKGATKQLGATKLNAHVPVKGFFEQHVLPELAGKGPQGQHPLIVADCLKFVISFRSQWPRSNFLDLLPMATQFLGREDFVLHSYAAIAIDRILAMREYPGDDEKAPSGGVRGAPKWKYPKEAVVKNLERVLVALFAVLNQREESATNEYVMRCVLRVISRAEEGCASVLGPVLEAVAKMLLRVSRDGRGSPAFRHSMFECIAALIHFNGGGQDGVARFEQKLMAPFLQILDREAAAALHPYIYQVMGLLLRLRGQCTANYEALFDKLLETSLWNNDGNIVAISGTFADYLRLVDTTKFVDERRLTGMLGIYQHLLSKRTQDYHAFLILRAIFQYVAPSQLKQYLKDVLELVCIRIRHKKSTALCANFCVALSILVLKHRGIAPLLTACNQIQQGILGMILEKIWLPFARNVTQLMDRKQLTLGMITVCKDPLFMNDPALCGLFPKMINCVVEIFEAGPLVSDEHKTADFYIQQLEEQGAGTKFVGLQFAKSPPHDVSKGMKDPRALLVECLRDVIGGNGQQCAAFAQQSKPVICKAINEYAHKFQVDFAVPVLK